MDDNRRRLFEECIEQNAASMYRVAFRLCGSRASAEELVQEAYLHAWKGVSSLRDTSKIRTWLFAILRRRYVKSFRKKAMTLFTSNMSLDQLPASSSAEVDPRQEALGWAIARLDDPYRLPLLLVAMEGMSTDEAAEVLQIPRGTVLSRLHRAREKVRQSLATVPSADAIARPVSGNQS